MNRAVGPVALALAVAAAPGAAQQADHAVGGSIYFQGYSFGSGLAIEAANLFIVPVGYQLPIGDQLTVDLYTAYARGSVERANTVYELNGVVDTRLRLNYEIGPNVVLTVGGSLPTGHSSHDANEAVVAGALATNLLGFREASWGMGGAVTTGVATASRVGGWGVGLGASYTVASGFEPQAGQQFEYAPGNEALVRIALDRNVTRSSKLTLGMTVQNYTADELDGRNLFQSGNRWRGDASYSFRTGRSATWALYVSDVWRERGDVFIPIVTGDGDVLADSVVQTGTQNLLIAGLAGSVGLRGRDLLPSIEARMQTSEEPGGSGWLVGGGVGVPLRVGRLEMLPSGRVSYGRLESPNGSNHGIWGGEIGVNIRRRIGD